MRNLHLSSTQIHILNQLLMAKDPLSSQFLSNGLGVSSKTIRKCIEEMKDMLQENGATIEIKPGSGYRLIILDEEAFDEFKQVEQIGKRSRNSFPIQSDRAHLVVRYLLTHKDHISIEDLCDLLYINRTSAKKILAKAREILAYFDLKAVFQSKKGLVVVGEEKNIRLCLVYEYSYFMTSYHYHGQEEYKDIIGMNDPYFPEVEQLILTYQNNYEEYNLSSYSVMFIARLIIVSKNRNRMQEHLEIEDATTKQYCNRNTYFVAKMILKECEKLYDTAFTAYDSVLVAICLVALRVTIKEPEIYRFGYFRHKDLALDIVQHLWKVNLFGTNKQDIHLIEDLSYNIEGLLEKYKQHVLTSQFRLYGYPFFSQMSHKMAMQVADYLKKTQGILLLPEDIIRISIIIHPLFGRYPFAFKKMNACVVSQIDKTEAKGMKERILRNFGKYIQEVDLLESYELATTDLSKYRVLFSSCQKDALPPIPDDLLYINLSIFFDEREKEKIRKKLVRGNTGNSSPHLIVKNTQIFVNNAPHDKEECIEQICNKMVQERNVDKDVLPDLQECEEIMPSLATENVVILSGLRNHTEQLQVSIFVLDKPVSWQQGAKTRIVVYWDRGKDPTESMNFENEYIPHILDIFFRNPQYIDDFIKNPTIEQFEETVQKIDGQVMTNGSSFQ